MHAQLAANYDTLRLQPSLQLQLKTASKTMAMDDQNSISYYRTINTPIIQ